MPRLQKGQVQRKVLLLRMAVFLKLGWTMLHQAIPSQPWVRGWYLMWLFVCHMFLWFLLNFIAKTKIDWAQRHKDLLALVKRVANPCVGRGFEIIWDNYPFQALGPLGPWSGGPFAAHCLSELFTVAPQLGPRKLPDQWCKVGAQKLGNFGNYPPENGH